MKAEKQRLDYLDIAKCIGIILVIWRHSINNSMDQLPFLTSIIKSFFMPLFFFLSGYLYKLKPTKDYLYSKAKTLLVPLILVYLYNFYTNLLMSGLQINHNYVRSGGYWFIESLLYVSILYHFFNVFLIKTKYVKNEIVDYVMFGCSIVISAVALLYCYLYGGAPSINSAAVACGFFSFGHIYRKTELKIKEKVSINRLMYLVIGIVLLVATFFISQEIEDISMAFNKCTNPIAFVICAILGSIGTLYISKAINHSKILCFFGKNTLVMLLTNLGIINIFRRVVEYFSENVYSLNELLKVVIIFAATLLTEVLVILFFNKVFPIFTGKPKYENK